MKSPKLVVMSSLVVALLAAHFVTSNLMADDQARARYQGAGFVVEQLSEDRYSVEAEQASLAELLKQVARLSGVPIEVEAGLDKKVTRSLKDVSLADLLQNLSESHALTFEKNQAGDHLVSASVTSQAEQPAVAAAAADQPLSAAEADFLRQRHIAHNVTTSLKPLRARGASSILLNNAIIDSSRAQAKRVDLPIPAAWQARSDSENFIVQFSGIIQDADKQALAEAGATILHYVPNHAFAVRMDAAARATVQAMDRVQLVEAFHPYFKLDADLLTEAAGQPNDKAREALDLGQLTLLTFQGADEAELAAVPGVEIIRKHAAGQRSVLDIKVQDADTLLALAHADAVQWIETTASMKRMNDKANKRVRASAYKRSYPGLDGSGVIVNVNDSGVDFVNPGFALDPSLPTTTNANTRIRYYGFKSGGFTSDGLPGDNEGHGTHVAGSILGNGALSASVISAPGSKGPPYATNQFAGIAPGAELVMLEDFNSYEHDDMARTAYTNGARISNNSWGNSVYSYGAMSAVWDDLVRDADDITAGNQELITFFAAGNDGGGEDDGTGGTAGTVGQPGNAKNVITIGAVEQARKADNIIGVFFGDTAWNSVEKTDSDWQLSHFSSRGPVTPTDTRVKPDVVAPGSYVLSVQSHEVLTDEFLGPGYVYDYRYRNVNSGTNFAFFSGTSMATPVAAGSAALIYQSYTNRFNKAPSPAMMKAMMVAGARMLNTILYRYSPFGDEPSLVDQGWGLIDVKRAVDGLPITSGDTNSILLIDQDESVSTSETKSYSVTVPANQGGLRIVLAWTDPAGNPVNSKQLVNDLDLYVDGPGGSGYLGNFFSSDGVNSYLIAPFTEAYADFYGDAFNNVEVINIPNLAAGTYSIKVTGFDIPQGPQNYALVVMKGMGYEGFTMGSAPDMALDSNGYPVVAYSYDSSLGEGFSNLTRQIFVKRWKGQLGDVDDLGQWRRMEDQWYSINNSMESGLGISRTLENSVDPSIAVSGDKIYVAWRERPQNIGGTNISHVFLKYYDGTNWTELANSAQGSGIDGSVSFDAFSPQVAVMGDGHPVVTWLQYNSATYINVRAAKWNGSSWVGLGPSLTTNGIPMTFPAIVNNEAEYLSMAVNHLGNPVVAWHENPAGAAKSTISVRRWTGATWESLNYSNTLFYIDFPKIAANPVNGDLYLTWRQQVTGVSAYHPHQIFAAQRTGASWTEMGGSFTTPGISSALVSSVISYPYGPDIAVRGSNVMVSWRAGNTNGNSVFVRQWKPGQSSWTTVYGAGDLPGVDTWSEKAFNPVLLMDGTSLPFVTFDASLGSSTGQSIVATYTVVADRDAPDFDGLFSAQGSTNNNVVLNWFPATDLSTTVVYQIYRSTTSNSCSSAALACDATNVFGNLIATVTNVTSYTNLNLTPGYTWCYGVRARDTNGFVDVNTVTRRAGPVGGAGDSDNDCLSNLVELAVGTAPCDPDSDDDGMNDGWEWFYSTNNVAHTNVLAMDPLDNGIINLRNGDPGLIDQLPSSDLDEDGASNVEEYQWYVAYTSQCVNATTNLISPDPTRADSDGDGLADGWEMIYGLNPVVSNNVNVDTDCDGLNLLQEFLRGTDPGNPDTDRDGLFDGSWSATNCLGAVSNLFEGNYGSDPLLPDTDFDGLDDGVEAGLGFSPIGAASVVSFLTDGDLFQLGWTNNEITNSTAILLRETFETSSRNAWTTNAPNGAMPFNFWHLSTAEPGVVTTNGVSYFNARSTNTAFRMANDPSTTNVLATYDIGGGIQSLIQCALLSPRFDATNQSALFIQWNEYYETEPNADFVTVQARGGSNQNWFSISSVISGSSLNTNPVSGFVTNDWIHRRADLSRFAGQSNVQVRFLFSAQNSINNNYKGWWVDDVAVFGTRTVSGWVRDNNGRALEGATVYVIGKGGVKKVLEGQITMPPGVVIAEGQTAQDGSFSIKDVFPGQVLLKASAPGYAAEFYNGLLFTGTYAFGAGLHPGVADSDLVGTGAYVNVVSTNFIQAFFELERGLGRAYLGVAMDKTAGARHPVYVDQQLATIWNGSNTTALASNIAYLTHTNLNQLSNLHPDWETNAVAPRMLSELAPGAHWLQVATNFTPVLPVFPLREGEKFLVDFSTNGASGSLRIEAEDGGSYPIWMDGRIIGNTPLRRFAAVGPHKVSIVSTNFARVALKTVVVQPGALNKVLFSTSDLTGIKGATLVRAQDVFGNALSNAMVYLNGSLYSTNLLTPTLITNLLAGDHYVQVRMPGFRNSDHRPVRILSAATNVSVFTLADSDEDFDRVGDRTEILGYTNRFLYSRSDDPDSDGLNNLFEFEVFRQVGIRLNSFDPDSDDDGMSDGAEVGYDGLVDRVAISTIAEAAVQGTNTLRSYFLGQYLGGVDNFGNGGITVASIDCDRFEANSLGHSNDVMPSKNQALTVFKTIPQFGAPYAVSVGHFKGSVILGDTRPDVQDTDGDSLWDGFEYAYGYINNILNPGTSNRIMDPLECNDPNADPDADGLSNYEEFLGPDRAATTNLDWTDPTDADSDNDGMPDGWEYFYGLNPSSGADKYQDLDGDGLVNLGEFNLGSNPRLYDTDGDGLPDGQEAIFGTDPQDVDTDNDGLIDGREAWDKNLDGMADGGFFPNWYPGADMDNDGYVDGPTDWDTDGDGMPDGWEVFDSFGRLRPVALDPNDASDADEDYDGDGLSNLQEYLVQDALFGNHPSEFSSNPAYLSVIWDYAPDPFNPDSDGDGMPDGWEVAHGLHPMDPIPDFHGSGETNINRYCDTYELCRDGDTDGDGLWNYREYSVRFKLDAAATTYGILDSSTHPWKSDTDLDGLGDGEEDRSFAGNPILQDSDGDRLMDGTDVEGRFGEVWSTTNTATTNHFDRALNDLWSLSIDPNTLQPTWTVVVPSNGPPEARWGAQAVYNPVLERQLIPSKSFCPLGHPVGEIVEESTEVLMDNRQLIVMGGRDGVTRFSNAWQFNIISNSWILATNTSLLGELSEFGAAIVFGHDHSGSCDAHNPGPPGTGRPNVRPWMTLSTQSGLTTVVPFGPGGLRDLVSPNAWHGSEPQVPEAGVTNDISEDNLAYEDIAHRSFSRDYTMIIGGWKSDYTYPGGPAVFNSQDDTNSFAVTTGCDPFASPDLWIPVIPAIPPAGIKSFAMAYAYRGLAGVVGDANPLETGKVVVVFGGMSGNDVLRNTYEVRPVWRLVEEGGQPAAYPLSEIKTFTMSPSASPSARWGAHMVYDPNLRVVVLFGGYDVNHRPLSDLWVYDGVTWSEVLSFDSVERPQPRGGACFTYYGGFDYNRGWDDYSVSGYQGPVLFGGTDGKVYFDDLWTIQNLRSDVNGYAAEWTLLHPVGEERRVKPSPRAFAAMSWAQNSVDEPIWPDTGTAGSMFMFGGRSGALPTGLDTDFDLVQDGTEFELGGITAGRDPSVNKLVETNNLTETIPFAFLRMGPTRGNPRIAIANFERADISPPGESVQATLPDQTDRWYHQYSLEFPYDVKDEWQLGRPIPVAQGPNGAPPYAYSGRWVFGTDLDGTYPDAAQMELLSPLMQLTIPPADSTSTNYTTRFNLVFHEWLDLADSNDIVRVEMIRPVTGSEIAKRISNPGKPIITLVPNRSSEHNTTGSWRRVIVPIEVSANETNVYFKFFFRSDASGNAGGWYLDDVAVIQGGEINGTYTNGTNAQVVLLGTNYNGHIQDQTTAYGSGGFQFGLLPAGNYMLGTYGGVTNVVVGPDAPVVDLGTNDLPSVAWSLIGLPPTLVTWSAVPGFVYRVDYSIDFGATWYTLVTQPATMTTESYNDLSGDPFRWYRVVLLGTP